MANKPVRRLLEQFGRRATLNHPSARHHQDRVGECQRFNLIVSDINQGQTEFTMNLFELAPQLPLEMRINDRQGFIKQNRAHIFPN